MQSYVLRSKDCALSLFLSMKNSLTVSSTERFGSVACFLSASRSRGQHLVSSLATSISSESDAENEFQRRSYFDSQSSLLSSLESHDQFQFPIHRVF